MHVSSHERDAFGQIGHHIHDEPVVYQLRPLIVSQWKFNQGQLLTDIVGLTILTNVNSVTQSTSDFQEGNSSALFGSANDYLEIADTPTLTSNQTFTLSLWFKLAALDTFQVLFSKDNQADKREYSLAVDSLNKIFTIIGEGDSTVDFGPLDSTDVVIDTWYHSVLTHDVDTDTLVLFTNGQQVDTYTYINFTLGGSDEPIRIGGNGSVAGASMSNGSKIDNVIWFNSVLSSTQIQYLFTHPSFH